MIAVIENKRWTGCGGQAAGYPGDGPQPGYGPGSQPR